MAIIPVNGVLPKIPDSTWVAENATITGDVTFGDDFHVAAQMWRGFQRFPQQVFATVTPINVGLIERGDALFHAGFNLRLNMGWTGILIVS